MPTIKIKTKFSAAHFVQSDKHSPCYRLHGHNWGVELDIHGDVGDDGMVVDKKEITEIVDRLDHKTLIPSLASDVSVYESGEEGTAVSLLSEYDMSEKEYVFPNDDIMLLPLRSVTSENLSEIIALKILEYLYERGADISTVCVTVTESDSLSSTTFFGTNVSGRSLEDYANLWNARVTEHEERRRKD